MDYDLVKRYMSHLRQEKENLGLQIDRLKREMKTRREEIMIIVQREMDLREAEIFHIEDRLEVNYQHEQLLNDINSKIFRAVMGGLDSITIFLQLHPEGPDRRFWDTLSDAQTSIAQMLREVGVKDIRVETIPQFRIRKPQEHVLDGNYDTVVSFRVSNSD